ncbi:MFS transporter [Novipirellula galeiformis]|uniref:MFS transporter n=1 Tax=Novipirellula galeiformis TaxID=2528004 RepID=UPI0018CE0172|nr:MFS transporter [Novipirellula galeiformis]
MTQAEIKQSGRKATHLVAFMWCAYFLNYCDRQAVFAMFPVLQSDLGLTDRELGLTGSIFLWVYGLGCPLAGQIADKYSKRVLVVFSLAIWSLVTVGTGFATSAFILLALRAAMGVSESLYMPAAIALTSNAHAPEKRSRAVATLTTAQIVGTVAGAWFGGWMAHQGYWREAFFILGAIGLLYCLPYAMFLRTVNEDAEVETKRADGTLAITELVKVPTFLLLCVVFPTFVFGLWMLYSWLPSFLYEKYSLDLADAAFTATAYLQSTTFIGLLGGGFLADKLFLRTKAARLWLMAISLMLCAPCLHWIGSAESLDATRIAAAGFGLFSGFFIGNVFPAAFEVVPANTRASAVGLLNFCGAALSGFAPLVGGIWKKSVGLERMLSYTSLAFAVAAVLLVLGILYLFPKDYERIHHDGA